MKNHNTPRSFAIRTALVLLAMFAVSPLSAHEATNLEGEMALTRSAFGRLQDGTEIEMFTLDNGNGIEAKLMTYGALLTSLKVPDRHGKSENIVLGFDSLEPYLGEHPYFGATVGRYCNRIAQGKFTLDGKEYELATNNGPNHLHGGIKGYDKVVWKAEPVEKEDRLGVTFRYTSPDGEEGYPGTLTIKVDYWLTAGGELIVEYEATTDKATPCNLTHHSYFNLAGPGQGDVLGHELQIQAELYLPVDDTFIPTGDLAKVDGTPMDFRKPMPIGSRIEKVEGGYDLCYVVDGKMGEMRHAARVRDPKSGRIMEISTTEPGIQFYTGNFLDGSLTGLGGVYNQYGGFCLETQHYPDSPNQPAFPSTILRPGATYRHTIVHAFKTDTGS